MSLDALEALARAATPGPWEAHGHEVMRPHPDGAYTIAEAMDSRADAAYLAALSPEVVLALVARLRIAERAAVRCALRCGRIPEEERLSWATPTCKACMPDQPVRRASR